MALQSYTISVGNLQDDTSGNNYAVNKAVYILKQDKTIQPIFADFEGNTPITQDGVNNVTNNRGEFSFYVEPDDYIARVGGIDKAFTVVGSDYFNSKVDETVNLIIDAVAGRGAYYPVGSFEAGFTYTDINQVGTLGTAPNITYYVYTGGFTNLPHTVPAITDPTLSGDYEQVFYGEASNVVNANGGNVQDLADRIYQPSLTYLKTISDTTSMIGGVVTTKGYYSVCDGGGSTGIIKTPAQVATDGDVVTGLIGDFINVQLADGNYFVMLSQPSLRNTGSKLDGVDDNDAFMSACEYSRTKGIPIRERTSGTLRYTDEADFTANGAGLIWSGVTKGKLLYAGADKTKALKVDQGGTHPVYALTSKTGVFQFGEVVQGNTTGNRAVVRSLFDTTNLEMQTARGEPVNEVIVGLTSGASASVTTPSAIDYGSSLQGIKLKGFTIAYDRTQSFDVFSRPLDWAECVGLYLNAFRNSCEAKDIRIDGFRYGYVGKANYLGSFVDVKTNTCWAGHTMLLECNNIIFDKNSANRSGSVADVSGWSLYYTTAYSTMVKAFDHENSVGQGIIYENLQGCSHHVGDIESNSNENWQITLQGLPGIDYDNPEKSGWLKGFTINGARFREDLGIEFRNGVSGCGVTGCHWDATSLKGDTFIARLQSGATFVENIYFDNTNSYYGDNETYQPSIPFFARSDEWINSQRLKYSCLVSQSLDIANANGYPVGNLPTGAVITQIDVMADNANAPTTAGSFHLDLGVDANIASILSNEIITVPTGGLADVLSAPYGLYKSITSGIGAIASGGGVIRARIDTNTAGTGRIFIRLWYKSTF